MKVGLNASIGEAHLDAILESTKRNRSRLNASIGEAHLDLPYVAASVEAMEGLNASIGEAHLDLGNASSCSFSSGS